MLEDLSIAAAGDAVIVDVVVQPRASRAGVAGLHDGALRLRVTAPPVDGAANAAVVKLLGELLGVPKSRVTIVAGQASRRKRVRIDVMDANTLRATVRPHLSAG